MDLTEAEFTGRCEAGPPEASARRSNFWSRRWRHLLIGVGAIFSMATYLWTQLSMLTYPGWHWASFRIFGSGDQLSYFSEVVNGSKGNLSAVEPYTETGVNSDPHVYYQFLGAISYVTHVTPADVWNIVSVSIQVLLVACIGVAAALVTRRWWAAFFGAIPFLIGTLSFTNLSWYTLMQSHAVLWGAFAVMFPLNSESASLAIAGSLFVLLFAAIRRPASPRVLVALGTLVGAGVGMLANFHTYGFLTALFFGVYGLSFYATVISRRWWLFGVSLLLIVVLFQVGPSVASAEGRLTAMVLGLVPALPGIVVAIGRWRLRAAAPLVAMALTASPQVVETWIQLRDGDQFLKYRESSSIYLGVTWKDGLFCALPLLIPLLAILVAGIHRRQSLWIAYPIGAITAWLLLAKNDVWGTNQEPYRLWIDGFALTAFTIVPIALDVALAYLSVRVLRSPDRPTRPWIAVFGGLAVITLCVGGISSIDWFRFYKSQEDQTLSLYTPTDNAMRAVTAKITDHRLVLADPCVIGWTLKAVTGVRVETFSPGLAWPSRLPQITAVNTALVQNQMHPAQLRAANVGWLVTDGSCTANWAKRFAPMLRLKARSSYGPSSSDAISLWQIKTGASTQSKA
ncbi:MAG: hypothetical protein JWM85_1478 [Acidimicrobiaceae bacterium]|nr:hypothetical protein [Acidimicrobiaceae bacterium]